MPKKSDSLNIQLYSVAPSPSRDYHGLNINDNEIVMNTWHISHGPYIYPKVQKCEILNYSNDFTLQSNIRNIFGIHVHEYLMNLCKKTPNIQFMPNKIMLKVLKMLSHNDILRLSQTSKIFWELCNTNSIWKMLFRKRNVYPPTKDEIRRSESEGWREVLRNKIEKHSKWSSNTSIQKGWHRLIETRGRPVTTNSEPNIIYNNDVTRTLDKDEVIAFKNVLMPKTESEGENYNLAKLKKSVPVKKSMSSTEENKTVPYYDNLSAKSTTSLKQVLNQMKLKQTASKFTKTALN